MKNKTIQTFLCAISLVVLLGGLLTAGAFAATAPKAKDGELGKLHAQKGVKCAQCHGKAKTPGAVPMATCVSCHGETAKLAQKTANVQPRNPHENRHYGTEGDCNLCHHQHKKSENFCLPCHERFDFIVP